MSRPLQRIFRRSTQPTGVAKIGSSHPRNRWVIFFVAWAALSLMSAAWSIATPISGAPDEPAHIIKAASVVRGEFIGKNSNIGQQVHVPAYIAFTQAQTCFAYDPRATANCSPVITGDEWKAVTSATSAGLYNPTYYMLVGWPSLIDHNSSGIYYMRIASGIVSSAFLAATLMMIYTWRRRMLPVLGFAVAATPMVFFLNGVVNPNSLETAGTLAAFVGVMSIVRSPVRRLLLERSVIVLISAAIAVNTRGLSPLWVGVAVLTPFILASRGQIRELARQTAIRAAVIGVALATAAALVWIVLSNSLGAGLTATSDTATGLGVGASPLRGFAQIFAGTYDYGQGVVGVFGWLDTPAPSAVFFTWAALIGSLALLSFVSLRGKAQTLSLTLMSGLLLLPPVIQAIYVHGGGIVWQGRYALPLYVCVAVGLAALLADRIPRIDRTVQKRLVGLVVVLWAVAQIYAFAFALKRYGVGASGQSWKRLLTDPDWSPPGGTILSLALCLVTFILGAVLLHRLAVTTLSTKSSASLHD